MFGDKKGLNHQNLLLKRDGCSSSSSFQRFQQQQLVFLKLLHRLDSGAWPPSAEALFISFFVVDGGLQAAVGRKTRAGLKGTTSSQV